MLFKYLPLQVAHGFSKGAYYVEPLRDQHHELKGRDSATPHVPSLDTTPDMSNSTYQGIGGP